MSAGLDTGDWITVAVAALTGLAFAFGIYRSIMAEIAKSRHDLRNEMLKEVAKLEADCIDRLDRLRDRLDDQQRQIIIPLMKMGSGK